jgi:excisionase family DNA binding protein
VCVTAVASRRCRPDRFGVKSFKSFNSAGVLAIIPQANIPGGNDNVQQLLAPQQVAEAMGVSESSIKRWCDQGLLESARTAGGHRRLPIASVLQFLRESGRDVRMPSAIGLPAAIFGGPLPDARDRYQEALVSGEEATVREVLFGLYLAGWRMSVIGDEVIGGAFRRIGDLWDCGRVEVYEERRACEMTLNALRELRVCLPPPSPSALIAVGATPEGDPYAIPVMLAELVLRESGWNATSLGSSLSFASLRASLAKSAPRLLWISVSYVADEERFVEGLNGLLDAACEAGSASIVGGIALDEGLPQPLR